MKNMWIPLPPVSHSAWPAGSERRPIRPMNRAHSELAVSTASARVVPRVSFRAAAARPSAVTTGSGA